MAMMQDRLMNLQNNMGGPGGKKGGDKSMAMMSSMQQVRSDYCSVAGSNTGDVMVDDAQHDVDV